MKYGWDWEWVVEVYRDARGQLWCDVSDELIDEHGLGAGALVSFVKVNDAIILAFGARADAVATAHVDECPTELQCVFGRWRLYELPTSLCTALDLEPGGKNCNFWFMRYGSAVQVHSDLEYEQFRSTTKRALADAFGGIPLDSFTFAVNTMNGAVKRVSSARIEELSFDWAAKARAAGIKVE